METNPLHDGVRIEPAPGPATIVIFGASGDLTRRKLLPALHSLAGAQRLPPRFSIIGVARTPWTDEAFREQLRGSLREFAGAAAATDDVADSLAAHMQYLAGEMDDPGLYRRLEERLGQNVETGVLFYLAIPPSAYGTVIEHLGAAGLGREHSPAGWRRVIVEKPFGHDLASARALNDTLHRHFSEHQVFRIDHYLGKETVQNLLVFRFANGMFEPIWNRRYIDHVQITAAETVGVEQRAAYYDHAGALRDMVQNHLMQLLTLVAMEPPNAFSADSIRDRKMDALLSIQPLVDDRSRRADTVVRAQYATGWVDGREVPGYRDEEGVAAGSVTETYTALRVSIDNWRWAGVPFYLRTGKRMPKRTTEIAIQFKHPPLQIFRRASASPLAANLLVVNVQPDEGISLRFEAKVPGTRMQVAPVMMHFRYRAAFGGEIPEAYETLLLDALIGDATLFARHDFAEAAWGLISPVHEAWSREGGPIPEYEAGEWGPAEADELLAREGRRWRTL
ncbi:MAG TPA: glucose-6-phosphate dehydrogenase [Vicinamibacterales bacterium]|nr:glucose-6-phosphate dehydrogenase [Vicinamibacterales bacterium]